MTDSLVNGTAAGNIEDAKKDELLELCSKNAKIFANDQSENGQRLNLATLSIIDNIEIAWPIYNRLKTVVARYDYDENTPGNGYRTFLKIFESILESSIQLNQKIGSKSDSVLFRKGFYTKEIESCSQIVASLGSCLAHLETLITWCLDEDLLPTVDHDPHEIWSHTLKINQYCFYGRHVGFQFCENMKSVLRFIIFSMVVFSEAYYSQGSILSKATNSFMTTTKYITDPEERARRVVNICKFADIDFLKAFWFLSESELMTHLPTLVAQGVAICKVINVAPEPLSVNINGKEINIPIPSAHIGKKSIPVRLISYVRREGIAGEANSKYPLYPSSRGLLLHCHGGGFVAQSSKSHEVYLRQWAKDTGVPILSIDYSLAPEAPFPRALEEVLYIYGWALNNLKILGTTGERIIGAGDSAGANLLLASTLKCLDMGITPPMGLFLAYSAILVNFTVSPSRLLGVMDPIIPSSFLVRCLKAYAMQPTKPQNGNGNETNSDVSESFEEISESDLLELQARKSPVSETSDTLTYGSLSSHADEAKDQTVVNIDESKQSSSEKYVSDFLEKYVLDSDTDTDGTRIPVLKQEQVPASHSNLDNSIQDRVFSFMSSIRGRIGEFVGLNNVSSTGIRFDIDKELEILEGLRPIDMQNPYMNPFEASEEQLRNFPPVKLLTTDLDPLLDENVMFAKKLRKANNKVTLDILPGLPHGFLSLSMVCKEAYEGSKLSAQKIIELLDLNSLPE